MTPTPSPIMDSDKWYMRCDPAKMAENYCKAAEATLTLEGIIDADAKQIATVESRRTTQPEIIVTREMA